MALYVSAYSCLHPSTRIWMRMRGLLKRYHTSQDCTVPLINYEAANKFSVLLTLLSTLRQSL